MSTGREAGPKGCSRDHRQCKPQDLRRLGPEERPPSTRCWAGAGEPGGGSPLWMSSRMAGRALRGCDPKKVLVGAAELADWHRRIQGRGVSGDAHISWPELMQFKRTFTDPVPADRAKAFQKAGIATYHGPARFMSPERAVGRWPDSRGAALRGRRGSQ